MKVVVQVQFLYEILKITERKARKKLCWRCRSRRQSLYSDSDSDDDYLQSSYRDFSGLQREVTNLESKNRKLADLAYARCQRFNVRVRKPQKEGEVDISDQSIQVNPSDLPDKNPEDDAILID